jgi:exopolysaccharide production protein ExoQ
MRNAAPCGGMSTQGAAADLVANTNVAGFEATFFVVRMVNPLDVDTALANIAKYTLNTENPEELRRRIATIGDGEIVSGSIRRSPVRASDSVILNRKCGSGMPKFVYREEKSNYREEKSNFPGMGFSGATLLAIMPVFAIFYILLVLPFFPDDGKGRVENILFWPVMAVLTLTLVFQNWARIDYRFFRSLPIASLIAYLVFAAASVTWAYSPDFAFSRLVVQVLALIVVVVPYALPTGAKYTIPSVHLCYAIALAVNVVYVLTTPSSLIGHAGYFTHKQGLGLLGAVGIILSSHELLHRGWRRLVAIIAIGLGFWLVFESESKSALAFALVAIPCSALILLLCKKTRLTPAFIVAAVVVASMLVSNPIERIGYRLYGDATLTGRTGIWAFANYQISHKPWLGWGFHSYYFVPNPPQNAAPGYIRDMPSSHSGYLDLKLETGRIGYWIFLVFIYSSLHLLERVRRKDPVRAWFFLSFELFAMLINLLDSNWLVLEHFWLLYLIVVAESVRYSWPSRVTAAAVRAIPVGPSRRLARFARSAPAVTPGSASNANISGPLV